MAGTTANQLIREFQEHFETGIVPAVYRAPGRVNLIGEHTDYNDGLVLPTALEMACYAAVAPAQHGLLRVFAKDLNQSREWPVATLGELRQSHDWSDYIIGVVQQLLIDGYETRSCDLYITSEVPVGSGLSSSAALEVASALAFLDGRPLDRLELARLCQRAEVQFVGMPCGIMDQYTSIFGQQGSAIEIDCRNLQYELVALPQDVRILAVNTMVKHELSSSAYRERVAECGAAVEAIGVVNQSVTSLRDVSPAYFGQIQDSLPVIPRKRARHIVTENERVLDFATAARSGDLAEMGRLFIASHRSLQYDFEVSCEELDFLVDTAIKMDGVYGSRMTGGGFGGCTVNLVAPGAVQTFHDGIVKAYQKRYQIEPVFYECNPSPGAGRL